MLQLMMVAVMYGVVTVTIDVSLMWLTFTLLPLCIVCMNRVAKHTRQIERQLYSSSPSSPITPIRAHSHPLTLSLNSFKAVTPNHA